MQWWVNVGMETQTAMSRRHVAAPDHPDAGRRSLSLARGPIIIQGVRDPMRGPGPCGGPVSSGRSGAPTACARVPAFSGTRGVPGPIPTEDRPRPLLGEQDSGPQGSGCSDVVKDNYKILA